EIAGQLAGGAGNAARRCAGEPGRAGGIAEQLLRRASTGGRHQRQRSQQACRQRANGRSISRLEARGRGGFVQQQRFSSTVTDMSLPLASSLRVLRLRRKLTERRAAGGRAGWIACR